MSKLREQQLPTLIPAEKITESKNLLNNIALICRKTTLTYTSTKSVIITLETKASIFKILNQYVLMHAYVLMDKK